ncbi:hypothetical protein [Ruminococcus flavefaciens]|uniref:hypothetical protein n=1 Tax=Ruminococcus flavefaciens TaxID=1265 RepID=UPI0026EC2127|nr:hypothetical protein [Ruminococcus flavefaciens]
MKDYKDVARSVFRRRDEYLKEKKRKREVFIKRSAVALSCCLMMLVGFNIWRTDSLKTIAPSPDKSQFNVTEANTTAPPTTDENGNTGIPVTITTAVVTANNGETAVQNGTTVTTVSGENAPAVTTTHKKNSGSSTVEPPLPTTFSFMEVTAARRTTVVTTTTGKTSTVRTVTGKTTTTTHRSTTENSRTSARTTTARTTTRSKLTTTTARTTRTTTTTRLNTTSVSYSTTRVYTTSSAVYSTTRIYTTSSAVYSTTRAYTTKIPDTTVVTTIKPSDSPSPVATESVPYYTTTATTTTTIATTVTTTSITGFRYNGNYYKTTGSTISRYDLGTSIAAERDDTTGLNLVFYKYGDIDLDFMCVAVIYGQNTGYIGVNEVWNPDTLGDILNGANAEKTMKAASLYDYNDKRFYVFSDQKSAFELLRDYSDRPAQITGLSNGTQRFMLQNAGEEPPALDTSNKLGSIHIVTSGLADDGNYLHFGYIHITDDGKLEVDLFYLKYTIDIGKDNAEELVNKLKTL